MPVNHADDTLLFSVILYPLAAGKAAIEAHAGWFSILFVVVSIPFGIAVNFIGRKLVYSATEALLGSEPDNRSKWIQSLVAVPAFFSYVLFPYAIVGAGVWATWFGTIWLTKHLL